MKITKKTRLLAGAKRVAITEFKVRMDGDTAEALLKGKNLDGVTGYDPVDGSFTARLYDGDTDMGEWSFYPFDEDGTWRCGGLQVGVDEIVKIVLTPDPVKTDFDHTPVEATDMVE